MASPFDAQYWDEEEQLLYEVMLPLFLAALAQGMFGGVEALPLNIQQLVNVNNFNQAAIEYARQYRYGLIKSITETTRKQTQQIITDWIGSGQSLKVLEKQLEGIYGKTRASNIAATETTRAFAMGNMASWETTGFISQGVWMTAEDEKVCVICSSHEGERIGIGDIDSAPPNASHPGCRCWLQPIVDENLVSRELDKVLGL